MEKEGRKQLNRSLDSALFAIVSSNLPQEAICIHLRVHNAANIVIRRGSIRRNTLTLTYANKKKPSEV